MVAKTSSIDPLITG